MTNLSLRESTAISQMARLMTSFLPGSGRPSWKGHVSFASIARDCGVGEYWQQGSKEPAIAGLLERTLFLKPSLFERLIVAIVRHSVTYRLAKQNPITRQEMEMLDGLVIKLGLRFPELSDEHFLDSLGEGGFESAQKISRSSSAVREFAQPAAPALELQDLARRFYGIASMTNRQAAGFELEKLLNDLFTLSGLEPRKPFKVVGEQIDGSFFLDYEVYLVEARWRSEPEPEASLLVFRGKIEGKSRQTRGVFISINGFTSQAIPALTTNKEALFYLFDGYDMTCVLEGRVDLRKMLQFKQRRFAEEGEVLSRYEGEN